MPANVVKPGQEKYWERAKARAAEEGHAEDWAYVLGIFKKMTLNKAFVIFNRMAEDVIPGQVPDPRRHEGYRMMTATPQPLTERAILMDVGPQLTPRQAVSGLGMPLEDELAWEQFIEDQEGKGEFVMRQEFMQAAREQELDPHLKLALFRRIQRYMQDSKPQPPTPIEIMRGEPLGKSGGARGGRYYARTQLPGGKYRYFYDENAYRSYKGADVRGHEASADRAHHAVHAHIQKVGSQGAGPQELQELARKHGARQVAQALRSHIEAGTLHHQGGRVYSGGVTHKEPHANNGKKAVP